MGHLAGVVWTDAQVESIHEAGGTHDELQQEHNARSGTEEPAVVSAGNNVLKHLASDDLPAEKETTGTEYKMSPWVHGAFGVNSFIPSGSTGSAPVADTLPDLGGSDTAKAALSSNVISRGIEIVTIMEIDKVDTTLDKLTAQEESAQDLADAAADADESDPQQMDEANALRVNEDVAKDKLLGAARESAENQKTSLSTS